MTFRRALLAGYLLLLLASALLRPGQPTPLAGDQRVFTLPDGSQMAWRAEGPVGGLPVLLLHGSPGDGRAMAALSAALPDGWRRLSPDMLGFGGSSYRVPDYSSRAHAAALSTWMDAEGIDSAHLVVHSMGGAVALELAAADPDRVRSITMMGAIGVVELELMGNHTLNNTLHGAQLLAIEAAGWLLPHFGALDRFPLNRAYGRNFYDTDQQRLRPLMEAYEGPMSILHGEDDFLVPVEAAVEHHRIVPQSELAIWPTDHFFVFRPEEVGQAAAHVSYFIGRVESGAPLRRADAAPERVTAAGAPFDPAALPEMSGPALAILGALIGVATFLSEDLTCISSGIMVAQGRMSFTFATLACGLGIFFGDILLVIIGRWLGPAALRYPPFVWILTPQAVDGAAAWYRRYGAQVIFTSRVIPGMRLPMYFAAGVLRVPLGMVTALFALAAAAWVPALVGLAALLGEPLLSRLDTLRYGSLLLLAQVIFMGLMLRVGVPLMTWRGRRLAAASWQRLTRWEFWPMWAVYPPVLAAAALAGWRRGSLTAFTAANPGMPASGFVGESKWDILTRLGGPGAPFIPDTALLSGPGRWADFCTFVARNSYPLVLKPDAGQRGQGVVIVRAEVEARAYLEVARGPVIAQAFVPGEELGIFYVRQPDAPTGTITSITHKRPVAVVGDGVQTLEQLILRHPEALPKAPLHLKVHASRLMSVPEEGKEVVLVEVGTHARGARFHDGAHLCTPALTAAIDRISQGYDGGFFFGRYDIRAPSIEALARGEGLSVIELNGVTSEPTHIYDPKHSIWVGWRALSAHWRLAMEIGAKNAARGVPQTSLRALWDAVQRFNQQTQQGHVAVDRPLDSA